MSARRWRDERGLTLPLVALALPVLIIMVGMAVDLGRQRSDRRLAQAGADVVALDMMRIVRGRTVLQVVNDPDTAVALSESAQRNGFSNAVGFVVDAHDPHIENIEWGTVINDSTFVRLDPFDANADGDGNGVKDPNEVPTAVLVRAERTTDYFFRPGENGVSRRAIATQDKVASFEIGTRLASVSSSDAALLNRILGGALGGPITILDYNGLVGVDMDLDALAAELGFGSPDELANASVNAQDFYEASAEVMSNSGNTAAANAFGAAAATVNSGTTIDMGTLMDMEQGGGDDAANSSVNAFGLLIGSAYAINGTNTLSVPSLAVTIPGVTSTSMNLKVTEKPLLVDGREGATGSTRQAQMVLNLAIPSTTVGLLRISGTATLTIDIAGGTGILYIIDCGLPGIAVSLTPKPVVTSMSLNLQVRQTLPIVGNVPVANVSGTTASISAVGTANPVAFDYPSEFRPDVGTGPMVQSNPTSLGIAGASNVTPARVTVLGVPGGPTAAAVTSTTNTLLNPILTRVDSVVVNNLSRQLGLNIGGADIGARDMSCNSIKLIG